MNSRRLLDARVRAAIRELGGGEAATGMPPTVQPAGAPARDVRRSNRAVLLLTAVAASVFLAGGVTYYAVLGPPENDPTTGAERTELAEPRIVDDSKLTLFSSETAEEWVRNSDYVVQVKVLDERATGVGDGRVVGRAVRMRVDDIIWSRPDAERALTEEFELPAIGWLRTHDGNVPLASPGTPRLEVGHSYVVSLVWAPRLCSEGDPPEEAHWISLGSSAVIPYDAGRLGYGESEGREVFGDIDQSQPNSLERNLTGESTAGVASLLRQQPHHAKDDIFPEPSC